MEVQGQLSHGGPSRHPGAYGPSTLRAAGSHQERPSQEPWALGLSSGPTTYWWLWPEASHFASPSLGLTYEKWCPAHWIT